jgi:hypothetical protein
MSSGSLRMLAFSLSRTSVAATSRSCSSSNSSITRAWPCPDSERMWRTPSIVANASSSGSTTSSSIADGDAPSSSTVTPTNGNSMSG